MTTIKMTRAEAIIGLAAVNTIEANYLPRYMSRGVIKDLVHLLSSTFELPDTGKVDLNGIDLTELREPDFTNDELDVLTKFVVLFTKLVSSSDLKLMSHGLVKKNTVKLMAKKLLGFNENAVKRISAGR